MVLKSVRARQVVLGDQRRLSRQPVLHFMTLLGTLVFIDEIRPARDFIRAWREAGLTLADLYQRSWTRGLLEVLVLGEFIRFHKYIFEASRHRSGQSTVERQLLSGTVVNFFFGHVHKHSGFFITDAAHFAYGDENFVT